MPGERRHDDISDGTEEIDGLDEAGLTELLEEFGPHILLHLPPRERSFMEWLRDNDAEVYDDLWGDGDLLVSMFFIPSLKRKERGFVICELEHCDNYFFTARHLKPDAREALPGILERARAGKDLSIGEVLLFEILQEPIDIWHFCYKYGIPLEKAKTAVAQLAQHDWMVHLTDRDDLAKYVEA
jgi:hypothetical protein